MRDKNHFCIAQFSLVFSLVCFSVVSCKFLSTSKSSMIKYFCVQSYPHFANNIFDDKNDRIQLNEKLKIMFKSIAVYQVMVTKINQCFNTYVETIFSFLLRNNHR